MPILSPSLPATPSRASLETLAWSASTGFWSTMAAITVLTQVRKQQTTAMAPVGEDDTGRAGVLQAQAWISSFRKLDLLLPVCRHGNGPRREPSQGEVMFYRGGTCEWNASWLTSEALGNDTYFMDPDGSTWDQEDAEVLALTVFGFSWGVREGWDRSTAVIVPLQLRL